MTESKIFLEGKQAALRGEHRFPNPHKENEINYDEWRKGWKEGSKERFENLPDKEKAEYWEKQWRQSELERHISMQHLSKMADLSEEVWESKPSMDNPFDKVIYENGHGRLTLGDCCKAEHYIMHHGCADIEEIEEYEKREWELFLERIKKEKEEEENENENK